MVRKSIGPGPGKYMLPPVVGFKSHDISRYRNPEYSMGHKVIYQTKQFGPGPRYNVDNLTNYGKVRVPAFSMKSRPQLLAPFQTPGPGTYKPELVPRMKEPRPPKYSIAHKYESHRPDNTPGPNKYEVPTTIGPKIPDKPANAAFSIAHRHRTVGFDPNPGPAKYNGVDINLYRNKLPMYTIPSRVFPPNDKRFTPGPIYLPKLPQKSGYSFGVRTDIEPYITTEDDMPCNRIQKIC